MANITTRSAPLRPKLPSRHEMFTLIYDPSEFPLARGTRLSCMEVDYGLVLRSLLPGTRLQLGADLYEVRELEQRHLFTKEKLLELARVGAGA